MGVWSSRGRSITTVLSAVALTASGTLAISNALAPDPINGCVSKLTGGVRILQGTQKCNALEDPISWNNSGPAGPQGPKGDTGSQGPKGEQGAPGVPASFLDNHPDPVDIMAAYGPDNPMEISAWDIPAGSYRVELNSVVFAHPSSSTIPDAYIKCHLRDGKESLTEVKIQVPYPSIEQPIELKLARKFTAPTHLNFACWTYSMYPGAEALVARTTFEITSLGQTRGL